jgi:3-oxoadipate enol-lactonase
MIVKLPTLIMYNENDLDGIDLASEQLHESIEDSQLVVIPNAGHSSPIQEPEAVTRAICGFVARVDGETD